MDKAWSVYASYDVKWFLLIYARFWELGFSAAPSINCMPGERGWVFLCMLTYSNQLIAYDFIFTLRKSMLLSVHSKCLYSIIQILCNQFIFLIFNVFFCFRELLIERNRGQHVQSYPEWKFFTSADCCGSVYRNAVLNF